MTTSQIVGVSIFRAYSFTSYRPSQFWKVDLGTIIFFYMLLLRNLRNLRFI